MAHLAAVLLASERAGYLSLGATFLNGTPFIAQLARQVLDLGGDPALLQPRTDYMRAGIRIALDDHAD
jgi:hypothetical protein